MSKCKMCIFTWIRDERFSSVSKPAKAMAFDLIRLVDSKTLATCRSTRSIARILDESYGSVRRWRRELIEAGLIEPTPGGGLKLCAVSTSGHGVLTGEHCNTSSVSRSEQGGCSDLDTPDPYKDTASSSTSTTTDSAPQISAPGDLHEPTAAAVQIQEPQPPTPAEVEDAHAPQDQPPGRDSVLDEGGGTDPLGERWSAALDANPAITHPWPLVGKTRTLMEAATPARVAEALDALETVHDVSNVYRYAQAILAKPEPRRFVPAPPPPPLPTPTEADREAGRRALAEIRALLAEEVAA